MKVVFLLLLFFSVAAGTLVLPDGAAAAGLVPCGGAGEAPCQFCHLFVLIHNVYNFLALQITPALAVVLFLAGGAALMFSGANEGLKATGKRIILGTVIGVTLVLLSWVLVNTTINVIAGFGVESEIAGQPAGFPWPWNAPDCSTGSGFVPAP